MERAEIYVHGKGREGGKEEFALQIENRRQPERMRVVIIRAPVKPSPFILGSFNLPLPTPLPAPHHRDAAPPLSGFLTSREIFLCASRNALEELFRGRGEEALGRRLTSMSRSSSPYEPGGKKKRKSSVSVRAASSLLTPFRTPHHPLTDASAHNEFIKHREKRLHPLHKKRR